jgi:ABC-type arginine transport system permease subunit
LWWANSLNNAGVPEENTIFIFFFGVENHFSPLTFLYLSINCVNYTALVAGFISLRDSTFVWL